MEPLVNIECRGVPAAWSADLSVQYKDELPRGCWERCLLFDHPSGVSDVSPVKNTGEAAALVCAKRISSKSLRSSVVPHLNRKVSFGC